MSASALQSLLHHPALNLQLASALLPPEPAAASLNADLLPWLGHTGTHEWFYTPHAPDAAPLPATARRTWYAPLTLLTALASTLAHSPAHCPGKKFLWIGRTCWPSFQLLAAQSPIENHPSKIENPLNSSFFLDPLSDQERFWAIDQALRCPGVAVVIADASALDPIASRRLQLAAETAGVLALLVRPPWELNQPSWAQTRWHVRPQPSGATELRWDIVLLRCKGSQPGPQLSRHWTAAWSYEVFHGTGALHLSARLGRPAPATPACATPTLRTA